MSLLFRGITSNHKEDFYCLNCFHSFTTENKLKKHYNVRKNHDYCYVEILKEDNKILKYNHGEISMKVPFTIYADLESLLEKMNTCHNNPKNSSTTKINKHTPSGKSLFTHCSFDTTKNMIPLTKEENQIHREQKVYYICKNGYSTDNNKKYFKVKDHCHYTGKYRGAVHDICNVRHKIPKEIPVVFHNGSTYDYHFIINKLAE